MTQDENPLLSGGHGTRIPCYLVKLYKQVEEKEYFVLFTSGNRGASKDEKLKKRFKVIRFHGHKLPPACDPVNPID
jgi:hypothetical protein